MCTLLLSILPGGERLSSSLDSKVRGMIFFFCLLTMIYLSRAPFALFTSEERGKRGVEGKKGKEA